MTQTKLRFQIIFSQYESLTINNALVRYHKSHSYLLIISFSRMTRIDSEEYLEKRKIVEIECHWFTRLDGWAIKPWIAYITELFTVYSSSRTNISIFFLLDFLLSSMMESHECQRLARVSTHPARRGQQHSHLFCLLDVWCMTVW